MEGQTAVYCTDCGKVYSARRYEGGYILSTRDGNCTCGNETVQAVEGVLAAD